MQATQLSGRSVADVQIHGICDERFTKVREVLAAQLASGADIGATAAVFVDGEPVVDIWGSYFDEARTRPWERDTIVKTFSTTKTMTALCALILADRGAAARPRTSSGEPEGPRRARRHPAWWRQFHITRWDATWLPNKSNGTCRRLDTSQVSVTNRHSSFGYCTMKQFSTAVLFPVDVRAMISNLNMPRNDAISAGTTNVVTVGGRSMPNLIAPCSTNNW